MIKQIYDNTLSRVPQCARSLIPQSLSGRILCVATFVFAAVAFYYINMSRRNNQLRIVNNSNNFSIASPECAVAKSAQSASQFESELGQWAQQEGGKASEAAERILECYKTKNTTLFLLDMGLKTLPECLGLLTTLRKLYVSRNKLKALPDSIGGLTALTRLYVCDNNLKALPDSIGGLTALKELGVSWNKLESLPDAMGGLTALTRLHVCGNKLKALPDSIGGLKALKVINLDGNELLTSIPESWLTLGHGFIIKLVGTGLSESDIQRLREMTRH